MAEMRRILIVDDEPAITVMLNVLLTKAGFEVCVAGDGEEALAKAAAKTPDLAIVDIQMPGMNGLQLSQRFKADPVLKRVPMILLSAIVGEDSEAEGLQKGDYFMGKPFECKTLLDKVRELLEKTHG